MKEKIDPTLLIRIGNWSLRPIDIKWIDWNFKSPVDGELVTAGALNDNSRILFKASEETYTQDIVALMYVTNSANWIPKSNWLVEHEIQMTNISTNTMNNTRPESLENGWSTPSNAGLDSYADNFETRQQKFALILGALNIMKQENASEKARNAAKQHFSRLEEAIDGALDTNLDKMWNKMGFE